MFQNNLNVAVIGDNLLDIHIHGVCERVSPEAPVLVLKTKTKNEIITPGGSLNVAYQLKNFCKTVSFGLIDEETKNYLSHMDLSGCVYSELNIPRKIRFYSDDIQVLRYDIEDINIPDIEGKRNLIFNTLANRIKEFNIVVLSNYNKGLFSLEFSKNIIDLCNENNIKTIVDPKCDLYFWQNCTIFKPNFKEAYNLTRSTDMKTQAEILINQLNCESVVITNAGDGVLIKTKDNVFEYIPKSKVKNIINLSGAGDAFTAVLAISIASNIDVIESGIYAFEAGTEYVKHRNNEPIDFNYLFRKIHNSKQTSIEELKNVKNLIFTNGCYDFGLTSSHVKSLKYAKSLGDKLVVAVNSDASVRKLKGEGRPIMSLQERLEILSGLDCVDYVISFDEETPLELIKQIMPALIVKGGDYKPQDVAGFGLIPIHIHPIFNSMSTTEKIQKCQKIILK